MGNNEYLFVGDPHAQPNNLPDLVALGKYIITVAQETKATVVISGDLYHFHGVIHAEVQYFWWAFFETMKKLGIRFIVLKGNHDAPGTEGSLATSLIAHVSQGTMVLHQPHVENNILFCPYTSGEQLVKWATQHPKCGTLFCHQTFDGSTYENGFYAGDGVDPAAIPQNMVISGHIHAPQEFAKILYPGSPRWQTLSDANTERAIWLFEFDGRGLLQKKTPYDTGKICKRIFHFVDSPEQPLNLVPEANTEYRVDIKGPESWIRERLPLFDGIARTRRICTDTRAVAVVKESDGVSVAFDKWVDAFQPKNNTDKTTLRKMIGERLNGF